MANNIVSAHYTHGTSTVLVIYDDGLEILVPTDGSTGHSQDLQAWVDLGNALGPIQEIPRSEQRRARYVSEADPYMTAAQGYQREYDLESDPDLKAAIAVKRDAAWSSYMTTKDIIRTELPDL